MKKQIVSALLISALTLSSSAVVFGSDMTIQNINKAISSVEDEDGQVDIQEADGNKVVFNIDNKRYVYLFDGTQNSILEVHIIDTDFEFDEDDYDVYFIDDDFEYEDYEYDGDIDYDSLISPFEAIEAAEEEIDLEDEDDIVAKNASLVWTEEGDELIYDVHILTNNKKEYNYEIKAYTGAIYERESYNTTTSEARAYRSEARRYYYQTNSTYRKKYKYEKPVIIVVTAPEKELPKDEPDYKPDLQPDDPDYKPDLQPDDPNFNPDFQPDDPDYKPVEEASTELTTAELPEEPSTFEDITFEIPTREETEAPTIELPTEVTTAEPSTEVTTAERPIEITTRVQPVTERPTEVTTTVQTVTERPTEATTAVQPATERRTEAATKTQPTTQRRTQTEKATQKVTQKTTQKSVIEAPTETTTQFNQNIQNRQNQQNRANMRSSGFGR